jgi:hypothetical protein
VEAMKQAFVDVWEFYYADTLVSDEVLYNSTGRNVWLGEQATTTVYCIPTIFTMNLMKEYKQAPDFMA